MRPGRTARALGVLALCLGLASSALAAAGGSAQVTDPAAVAIAAARSQVGDPYAWGGSGPDAWDCSGIVQAAWRKAGVTDIPRVSRQQHAWAVPVPRAQVLPGDLVFFGNPVTHVGLVTRVTATAVQMVDAGSTPQKVVERAVWRAPVVRYGRVPRKGMVPVRPEPAPTPAPVVQLLPALTQATPSSAVATKAAALARKEVGAKDPGDAALLADVWRRAGGAALPTTRSALVAKGTKVALADARVGDVVVYAAPAAHVGIYVGGGLMVDASRSKGKVLLRAVWASPGLSLVRLPG